MMNIQQLRHSLKQKWMSYYSNHRSWLAKMRVWGTYDGQRRPSSSFILATVSVLEPELEDILPFVLELNNDPDQIVAALGLNFNPEEQLHLVESDNCVAENEVESEFAYQTLPEHQSLTTSAVATNLQNSCQPVSSISFNTEFPSNIPIQTLANYQSITSCTTTSEVEVEVESQSKPLEFIANSAIQVESQSKPPIPPATLFSMQEASKNPTVSSVGFVTQVERKSKPRSLVAVGTSDEEYKSRSVSLATFLASNVESKAVSIVSLLTKVESQDRVVITSSEKSRHQVNPPPAHTSNLANWIDDSCQGRRCDKEDTRFAP